MGIRILNKNENKLKIQSRREKEIGRSIKS
jgi:hypothetical protein